MKLQNLGAGERGAENAGPGNTEPYQGPHTLAFESETGKNPWPDYE